MSPPRLTGLHHVTLPVSDLETSAAWYATALGATRIPGLDHHDPAGNRYSVVVALPGLDTPLQLRLAPEAVATAGGYDPLTLGVGDRAELDTWAAQLDSAGVAHGPVTEARLGHALSFHDPDGTLLRLYTAPAGGLASAVQNIARNAVENDLPNVPRNSVRNAVPEARDE
ncbi:VOC family protein [Streptomyces sp. SID11385]|uniref:VOC family protein n=1 Tax=Streptomyces sp. SID11385 TaxID=2706031 RepID=UPI0013C63325|nr:VOC family protein [Streptomyces sp. SID11385]NEA38734.1 VOC family protein [Streptomyces sp. SID11385]